MKRARITELKVSNLLSFDHTGVTVALGSLTVLIGANGSGKTNLVRALRTDGGGADGLPTTRWRNEGAEPGSTARIERKVEWEDGRCIRHRLNLTDVGGRLQGAPGTTTVETGKASAEQAHAQVAEAYESIQVSRETEWDEHGEAVKAWRQLKGKQARTRVLRAAGYADEQMETADEGDLENALKRREGSARLSNGTARAIRKAAEIEAGAGRITIVEKPESGVHPDIASVLAKQLIEASERGQYMIITYSMMIADAMSEHPESIRVVERAPHRGTSVEPLSLNHVQALLKEEGLGAIWSRGELGGNRW